MNDWKLSIATTSLIAILTILLAFSLMKVLGGPDEPEQAPIVLQEVYDEETGLTEWEIFQIALIEVESENDPMAISSERARGILQITPIYVKDVNRIIGTEYTAEDAHNDSIAIDCFHVIQDYYNPEHNIDSAIYLHNPRAGAWYRRRVLNKMAEVERREEIRNLIINY